MLTLGTGKTTCAKFYGQILKELNYLTNGQVLVRSASDFIGQYIGESSTKTNAILKEASGKVLVIDEAYALNDKLYGKQVLDTIVEKVQGTPADDMAVLLLGYTTNMKDMIREQNPGLARRFPLEYAFHFEDYTNSEFLTIFQKLCSRKNIVASQEVTECVLERLSHLKSSPNFGNVGALEQLVTAAVSRAVNRGLDPNNSKIELCVQDVHPQEEEPEDPKLMLDSLVNIENIKAQINGLENAFRVAKRGDESRFNALDGMDPPKLGHFLFYGNPGDESPQLTC
jgi:hypothetical protein